MRQALALAFAALVWCGQSAAQQPVDLHLPKPNPAPNFRTGAAVCFGFGLLVGVPMVMADEANMNDLGKAALVFTSFTSAALFSVAIGHDLKRGKHPNRKP